MHVIRLHGPWTVEITGPGDLESRRVHLPREWSELAELMRGSSVTLVRRFHRPTGLDARTIVSLAIPRTWPIAAVTINGEQQQAQKDDGELLKFDISNTIRMREAHDLRIEFRIAEDLLSSPYFVGIEIMEPAS
jgi:hypothetical protein